MKQYCRYCAFCFKADDFRCGNHPLGEQPHFTREEINRVNHCPDFILSDMGDAETGRQYNPRKPKQELDQIKLF